MSLDDAVPGERERGLGNDFFLLRKGHIDEIWLTGTRVSSGMSREVAVAIEVGIPVIDKTNQL